MKPGESPWVEIPDDWLDADYGSDPEIARLQWFLDKKAKAEIIRKHLLAEGIGKAGTLELENIEVNIGNDIAIVRAQIKVTGQAWKKMDDHTGLYSENDKPELVATDTIKLERTLLRNSNGVIHEAYFDYMGVGKAKMPGAFANEYYRRVIPFLRRIGVVRLETKPTTCADVPTSPEGRLSGAYVWSYYGYTNSKMADTINEFLDYVKKVRKITLTNDQIDYIHTITRMRDLAQEQFEVRGSDMQLGKQFLLGDEDGNKKYTMNVSWAGYITDINNEASKEMTELRNRLARKIE